MLVGKKSVDKWFPVVLLDNSDFKTPKTGKVFGDVTVKYSGEGGTSLSAYTVTTDDWKESGEGMYWLNIGASEFTSAGKYEVSVACPGCLTFRFPVEVCSFIMEDFFKSGSHEVEVRMKNVSINNSATGGNGVDITGSSIGMSITGHSGHGLRVVSTGSYSAIAGISADSGHGMLLKSMGTGHGLKAEGGLTSGDGINTSAPTSGKGLKATGAGTDGHGVEAIGAGSYGCGIEARASDGDGIFALGGGSHGHGLHAKGSASCSAATSGILAEGNVGATGSGIKAYSALGKDIDAAEIGTPVNLDGTGTSLAANAKDIFDNLLTGTVDANVVTIEGADATDTLAAQAQVGANNAMNAFTADGVSLESVLEQLLAMVNGRFVKNISTISFYRRDNTTELFRVNVDEAGRVRL